MRAVPGEYQPYRVRLEAAGRDECPVGVIGPEAAAVERALEVLFALGHEVIPYGQADSPPKMLGERDLNVFVSPLPRNKRASNPRQVKAVAEK